jgi:hypothetical protein
VNRALLLLFLASCASSERDVVTAKIDTLDYVAPMGWKPRDVSSHRGTVIEWTPDGDNDRKESLVVSRVEQPALAMSPLHLRRALVETTSRLPDARFSSPRSFVTRSGLSGWRTEGTFSPLGPRAGTYQRIHAVLVDGSSLVHVLFTARDLDREHIDVVLDGIRAGA